MSDAGLLELTRQAEHWVDFYRADNLCTAYQLCDRHDPDAMAYRIIDSSLIARDYTYRDLKEASERFSAALQSLGVQAGDRVATLMGKGWPYLVTLMGIWRLGAVHVPLFTAFAPPAIALRLLGSKAKIVVCDQAQRAKLMPGEDIPVNAPWQIIATGEAADGDHAFETLLSRFEPGMEAVVVGGKAPMIHIYTSGTTGNPKGVVVPVHALAAFRAYAEFALNLRPDDLYWCSADPGWAYGLYFGILASLVTGTRSMLFTSGFDADMTLNIMASQGVTNFSAAPTVYRSLRSADLTIPPGIRLRCATSAGEPLTPEVNDWALRTLGVEVHDHYGQTETGMMINNHHHPLLKAPLKPGSMGRPMPGWSAAVLHPDRDEAVGRNTVGRIAFDLRASPLAWFAGYYDDPAKSAERFSPDGRWYLTGDTGYVDDDGYFHFSSRDDDVILMAGYRIGPFEVESVMSKHPAVAESAVISVPDEVRGEVIEAFVVLRDPATAGEAVATEIQQWVKKRYAAHAYPRKIHFAHELPKTPSGKIQRAVLKKQRIAELVSTGGDRENR